jgi:outer membrane protein assembly factor BamB
MSQHTLHGSLVALAALALVGCGQTAFSPHFADNNLGDLQKALRGVTPRAKAGPMNGMGKPLAFIVTKDPTRILAYDLESGTTLWSEPTDITSKVTIGRQSIYFRSGERTLEARAIANGKRVWTASLIGGERLLGITTDGDDVYYVTENIKRAADGTAAFLVAVNGATGGERWVQKSDGRLGAPVARDGRVFLPLRTQSLAVVDAAKGVELARVRSKEETVLWVRSAPAGIFFGGVNGVYLLDERAVSGTREGSRFLAAPLPTSVRPVYWWDGYNPSLAAYTAYDRNRMLWQVAAPGDDFADNMIVVHNYRFLFAFDTRAQKEKRSGLRWAYGYPRHDVVASVLTSGALVLVTVNGDVVVLDARVGLPLSQQPLKVQVVGASFDADGFAPTAHAKGKPDLRRSLAEVIWDPDRRFGPVKLFCVEQLAQLSGGSVAADLVKIVSHEGIDPLVYQRAGDVLVARHDKASIPLYLELLKVHTNFIEGTQARAVDIMARVLGDLKAPEAVRPLLLHLADHETPQPAIVEIVKALIAIGDPSVVEPLRDFLLTYRCDPDFNKNPAALQFVAEGLLKMGGENERQLLSFVENDANTLPSLRTYLGEALKVKSAAPKPAAPPQKDGKK